MKNPLRSIPDSLLRVLVLFFILLAAVFLIRFALPPSLIETELHVQSTVARETAKPVRYAGSDACADCHDEYKVKKSGYHQNLSCETCHGAARAHADDPTETKPEAPRKREFCSVCHTFNPSRPTGFPQINPVAHNPLKPCISCHNPHDPKPPRVPQECEACHAEIARTKSVSPHVRLECTTCHSAPNDHKINPRSARASIPATREFCGKCHGSQSTVQETPKVDLTSHGEKYLCWQCHYPHMPELD